MKIKTRLDAECFIFFVCHFYGALIIIHVARYALFTYLYVTDAESRSRKSA
ncbi:hypothetical protein P262_02142 [Cronobacter malonaticus]|uniref:Uncharacterized protein n=1 Tax=Cronobacter malonaticus TaxID=413503 RepID=V5TY73_9ENTR|nr:hypothetical protein P262_02142 [Cronobacter malonaticus]